MRAHRFGGYRARAAESALNKLVRPYRRFGAGLPALCGGSGGTVERWLPSVASFYADVVSLAPLVVEFSCA